MLMKCNSIFFEKGYGAPEPAVGSALHVVDISSINNFKNQLQKIQETIMGFIDTR